MTGLHIDLGGRVAIVSAFISKGNRRGRDY